MLADAVEAALDAVLVAALDAVLVLLLEAVLVAALDAVLVAALDAVLVAALDAVEAVLVLLDAVEAAAEVVVFEADVLFVEVFGPHATMLTVVKPASMKIAILLDHVFII